MRTHLLLSTAVVALLGASSAFADSNTVYLNQPDSSQDATITQSGSGNNVGSGGNYFLQQNGSGTGDNQLTITQTGNNNWVSRDGAGFQSGTTNTANISQAGFNSDVELQQNGTNNGKPNVGWTNSPNYDTIVQDSSSNGSKAGVYQTGNNNAFDIVQGGNSNNTSVTQNGTGGLAFTRQAVGNWAQDVTGRWYPVNGSNNNIAINQTSASINYAVAVQGNGDGNGLAITQSGDWLGANIWQIGSGNYASSVQSGNNNVIGLADTNSSVDTPFVQQGNSNKLINSQTGSYSRRQRFAGRIR